MRFVALLVALHISGSGVSSFGLIPAMRTTWPRQSSSLHLINPSSSAPKRVAGVAVARGHRRSRLVGGERPQRRCGAQAGSSGGEGIGVSLVAEQGRRRGFRQREKALVGCIERVPLASVVVDVPKEERKLAEACRGPLLVLPSRGY